MKSVLSTAIESMAARSELVESGGATYSQTSVGRKSVRTFNVMLDGNSAAEIANDMPISLRQVLDGIESFKQLKLDRKVFIDKICAGEYAFGGQSYTKTLWSINDCIHHLDETFQDVLHEFYGDSFDDFQDDVARGVWLAMESQLRKAAARMTDSALGDLDDYNWLDEPIR